MSEKEIREHVLSYLDFLITGFEAYDPRSVYGLIDQINEAVDNYEENIRENGLVLKR